MLINKCRRYYLLLFLGLSWIFYGCATIPPAKYDVQSSKHYQKKYDEVWEAIISSFAEANTPIKTIEKVSGIIATESMRIPFTQKDMGKYESYYCDCGAPGGLNVYRAMRGQYNVFAKRISEERTTVQINTIFEASMWIGKDFLDWVYCSSKGLAEAKLLNSIESRLNIKMGRIGIYASGDGIIESFGLLSPAKEVGMQVGDKIIAIDGVEKKSLGELLPYLTGEPDTEVKITVFRDGKNIDYIVKRKILDMKSVK